MVAVKAKPAAKNAKTDKPKRVAKPKEPAVFEFDPNGIPDTRKADGSLILGIPRAAFTENVPAKGEEGRSKALYAARIAFLTYVRDSAEVKLKSALTASSPAAKKKSAIEKLQEKIAKLKAELGEDA